MRCQDTYKEVREFVFPNCIARVHIPDLTEEERARRMQIIKNAAEDLMRAVYEHERNLNKG